MKVYAHYEIIDTVEYRWHTILQFGDSWDLIGSVVMKNPGSSSPKNKEQDADLLKKLADFTKDENENWWEFSADNTMQNIEKLFRERQYSETNSGELNGIIQVYNLFNTAYLRKALEKNQATDGNILCTLQSDIKSFGNSPIYLGWGDLGKDKRFIEKAKFVFETIQKEPYSQHYLNPNFQQNKFYHPQFLCMYGVKKDQAIYLKQCFFENTTAPTKKLKPFPYIDMKETTQLVLQRIQEELVKTKIINEYDDRGMIRYSFINDNLSLTITDKGKGGYIGFCHKAEMHTTLDKQYSKWHYPYQEEIMLLLQSEYGYSEGAVWLGTKPLKAYGFTPTEIVDSVVDELKDLIVMIGKIYNPQNSKKKI
jgi:hypothetical protein